MLEGVEYEEGSKWQPEGPCSSCSCVNGERRCTHTQCPSTECLHPSKIPGKSECVWALLLRRWPCDIGRDTVSFISLGSCCAVCESCTYNHRIYSNGQRFTTPDHPCHICTCQVSKSPFTFYPLLYLSLFTVMCSNLHLHVFENVWFPKSELSCEINLLDLMQLPRGINNKPILRFNMFLMGLKVKCLFLFLSMAV